jgi:hypothetical protein
VDEQPRAPFIFNSQLHMLEAAIELQEAAPSAKGSNQIKDQITFILQWFLDCTNIICLSQSQIRQRD